ncbi:hypothetical protein ACFL1E_05030 [Candidatus Omnitrophota bacterium]
MVLYKKVIIVILSVTFFTAWCTLGESVEMDCAVDMDCPVSQVQLGTIQVGPDSWEKGIDGIRSTFMKILEENLEYRKLLRDLENQIANMKGALDSAEAEKKELKVLPDKLKKEVDALDKEVQALNKEKRSLQKNQAKLTSKNEQLEKKIEKLNTSLAPFRRQIKDLQQTNAAIEKEKSQQIAAIRSDLTAAEDKISRLESLLQSAEQDNFDLNTKLLDTDTILDDRHEKIAEIQRENLLLSREIENLKQAKQDFEKELARIVRGKQVTASTPAEKKILVDSLQDSILENDSKIATLGREIERLAQEKQQFQKKLTQIIEGKEETKRTPAEKKMIISTLQDSISENDSKIATLGREIERLAQEKQQSQKKLTQIMEGKEAVGGVPVQSEALLSTLQNKFSKKDAEIIGLSQEIDRLTQEKQQAEKKLSQVSGEKKVAASTLEENKALVTTLKSTIDEKDKKLAFLEKEKADLADQIKTEGSSKESLIQEKEDMAKDFEAKIADLASTIQETQELLRLEKERSAMLAKTPDALQKQILELNSELAGSKTGKTEIEKEISELKDLVKEDQKKIASLNRERAMLESLLNLKSPETRPAQIVTVPGAPGFDISKLIESAYNNALAGNMQEAAQGYIYVLILDSNNQDARYNLGCLYAKLWRFEDAISQFKRTVEIDANDKDAHYNLWKIYEFLNQEKEAQNHKAIFKKLK